MIYAIIIGVILIFVGALFTLAEGDGVAGSKWCEECIYCGVDLNNDNFGGENYIWGTLEDGHEWYKYCKNCLPREQACCAEPKFVEVRAEDRI